MSACWGTVQDHMGTINSGRKLLALVSSTREFFRHPSPRIDRAIHFLNYAWKIRALSKALAKALEESHQASSWPGERLPVSLHFSNQVEQITRRIQIETAAYRRIVAVQDGRTA